MPKYQTYGQYDAKKDEFPESAEKVLRANEEAAGEQGGFEPEADDDKAQGSGAAQKDEARSTAQEANKREGLYRGAGAAAATMKLGQASAKGRMKKWGPTVAVVALIGGLFLGVGFSQALMPFHVIESLTEMTDGSFTARAARMPTLVRWLFNMESETNYTTKTMLGTKYRYRTNIESSRVKTRLAAEGIEVDTSGKETVLKYKQADGSVKTVEADDYAELWQNDSEFRNKMNRGGRSFLGRIAAHIDLTMADFLSSHSLTKNLFANWINKVYDAEGQTAKLNSVIKARAPDTTGDFEAVVGKSDDDGSHNLTGLDTDGSSEQNVKVQTDTDLKAKYADMISNVASVTTSAVCGTAAVASAVTVAKLVIAHENARGTFSAWAEGVDKAKTRDYGNESPINAVADEMIARDENGLTALQSETMKSAISGGTYKMNLSASDITENSTSAMLKGDGFWSGLWSELGNVGSSTKWIVGCAAANIATAAVSIVVNIATFGTFSFGKLFIGIGSGLAISGAVATLANYLVENATTNFCLDTSGVKRGACVYMGAANYNGLNFQNGGGSLATKEKATEFYRSYKVALADEAELIWSTKSPFDASSSHTFLGSIASKLGTLAVEMPSLSSVASSLTGMVSNSLSSLLPTAAAVEEVSFMNGQLREDCANLDFGDFVALGDANCEPWYITDQSTNDLDPEEVFSWLKDKGQFETDENGELVIDPETGREIVKEGSDLSKAIRYGAYRSSPFGLVDQNILNAEAVLSKPESGSEEEETLRDKARKWLRGLLEATPLISDFIQAMDGASTLKTLGWATGANWTARSVADTELSSMEVDGGDGTSVGSGSVSLVSWNDFMRYAQSYIADDRYMQTVEEDYQSPVLAYAEEAGLTTPDDELNLVEYLAKYTGYTPENVQIALNELEYWTYVAQYDPEGKGPVVAPEEEPKVYELTQPSEAPEGVYLAEVRQIVYADLRSRDVATA